MSGLPPAVDAAVDIADDAWLRVLDAEALESLVARGVEAAVAAAGPATPGNATRVEVGVTLTSDAAVRRLNRDHRGRDSATNVLSFPVPDAAARSVVPRPLGDIVLASGVVAAEAAAAGLPIRDHLLHLVVHGCLHLLGHDHETEPEAEAMEALEVRVLAGLGVADPYAAANREAGR